MALTRGDKMIIIGAVALAATVVVGLSVLKKARLFSGASDLPPAVVAPAPAPGAAPIQATPVVVPPPPTSRPAPSGAPLAPPPGATPTPAASGQPASPSALPAGSAATASAARPALAGDETLEHMSGYGTHQMLALIESGRLDDIFKRYEKVYVFYLTLDDHIRRCGGYAPWDTDGPRYILQDGVATYTGSFAQSRSWLRRGLDKIFEHSNLYTALTGLPFDTHRKELTDLYLAM